MIICYTIPKKDGKYNMDKYNATYRAYNEGYDLAEIERKLFSTSTKSNTVKLKDFFNPDIGTADKLAQFARRVLSNSNSKV